MVGPVSQDLDLRRLPYIPPSPQRDEERLMRHPPKSRFEEKAMDPLLPFRGSSLSVNMPSPLQTFAGFNSTLSGCLCLPPDTDGDVGPNHYIQSVNTSIRIHDKTGAVLSGPTTYQSFFSALGPGTACGTSNQGDGIAFYDHIADRWVVSDFAFSAFPGTSFYQCIGVSKTSDPVAGGWWLYAVQVDPANPAFLGDYPKFGLWPDAYYMSVNLFSNGSTFNGVRVYAFNRGAMIGGGAASTIAFTINPADLGDSYSFLPATFRTGSPPPVGQPEWFLAINSSLSGGTVENQVFARRFHVDFGTPANSTFGVGPTHTPDGTITVNGFVDAFTSAFDTTIVPNGTATASQFLDTLGDKLMYPLVYQKLGGVESLYASHTVNNNEGGTGPTAIRWYQFNMTGNTIPATPTQQQTFNNGADGLWRWMPSINVDSQGNLAVGYSTSSTTLDPGIRYAGRLAGDPPSTLAQGEAVLIAGAGHQTSGFGRWGDYSSMFVDPSDNCTFWHTNEYYTATSSAGWDTRIGSFKYPGCIPPTPTPTNTPTNTPTRTNTPTPTPTNTPTRTSTPTPTRTPVLANRVFVSARTGNDLNACNSILTPCETLAGAVAQTAAGGEAIILDSGGYGSVTITRAVTIEAPPGVLAFIHPSSGDGITVNAGAGSDTVVLRGLTLNVGTGNGITLNTVGALHVENCIIGGFQKGLAMTGAGLLFVKDTIVRGNSVDGIDLSPSSGTATASIDRTRFESNGVGLLAGNNAKASIRRSVASGNSSGLVANGTGAELDIDACLAANNATVGVASGSTGGTVRITGSAVTNNGIGLQQSGSGALLSRTSNTVEGNTLNTSGTIGSYTAK